MSAVGDGRGGGLGDGGQEPVARPPSPPWWLFEGTGVPLDPTVRNARWPEAPPWRRFLGVPSDVEPPGDEAEATRRLGLEAATLLERSDIALVNAAIHLRRPLLITGKPGSGKSSLAFLIARELGLGRVLKWPVTSRTTLRDGVYEYDAIGRAQAALNSRASLAGHGGAVVKGIARMRVESRPSGRDGDTRPDPAGPPISDFIRLGPLGTAMVASRLPRVLLVDELDKGDFDLPNDLLNVFEDGSVVIPELVRLRTTSESVTVLTDDPGQTALVDSGVIRCAEFPIVIITSNGEREFSPAFLRRCVRLAVREPAGDRLNALVRAHFTSSENFSDLVRRFEEQRDLGDELAADQLLNAVHLAKAGALDDPQAVEDLLGAVWQSLSPGTRPR